MWSKMVDVAAQSQFSEVTLQERPAIQLNAESVLHFRGGGGGAFNLSHHCIL